MGNEVFALKWRNWKLHFKEQDSALAAAITYPMPRVYNLLTDPQEKNSVLLSASWVPKASFAMLEEHIQSLQDNPPIPAGALDPYEPHR